MKVLVLGGTQFMGRLTVEALLKAGHEVVLFNRGRTANPFEGRPTLRHVSCDRMGDRDGFREALRGEGPCDAVVDFIGFQETYMQDVLEALTLPASTAGGRRQFATKHYIFVSTDSVYWAQKLPTADARVSEDDSQDFSPPEFEKHLEHCQKTSLGEYQLRYGGNKLGCERVLEEAWQADGFPFTALRLPDVYGPCDNLGGFWELLLAIEMRRPVPAGLPTGRVRAVDGREPADPKNRRFSWAFAEDVRDAILACVAKGPEVHGATMNVAHEEAVHLRETARMIAEAMGLDPEAVRFDDRRDAALPSTDYGALDVSRALRLLRPWRPTPMRAAVHRSVQWFLSSRENRRYHRLVHREPRRFDESGCRRLAPGLRELPCCWVGAPEKAALVRGGPAVLADALPELTGQAVLRFMQRLMDQAGEAQVASELQRGPEVERQTWVLRHFAGHLLTQSEHDAAYRLEAPEVLAQTDLLAELESPLAGIRADSAGQPPARMLQLGGRGSRTMLRRVPQEQGAPAGFWDCALLGRRKWRLFPPDTPLAALCVDSVSGHADESPADCFACGPDVIAVQARYTSFGPATCWEYEQTMGDAVVVPNGWWFQTYDDDRTLSISAEYGAVLPGVADVAPPVAPRGASPQRSSSKVREDSPEVIDFELVD